MAQVNISHFISINSADSQVFSKLLQEIVALEVHAVEKSAILPDSVSVLVIPIDTETSLSGAETEVQLLVSGNNWPKDNQGVPFDAEAAKKHFDKMAQNIYKRITAVQNRKVYVWVTPFYASGWAE